MNCIYWRSAESFSKGTYPWGLRHSLGFWCQEKQLVSAMHGQCLFCLAWGWMLCWRVETGNWFWILYHPFFVCYCISHAGFCFCFVFCFWLWGVRGEGSNHVALCRCSICISINLEPPGDTWAQAQHALCFNLWESILLLNKLIHMYSLFQTAH